MDQDNVVKTEVTFPIRFTRLFIANAIDAYWSGSDTPRYFANSVSESNNTKAVFVASDRYAASYYWFALGLFNYLLRYICPCRRLLPESSAA